MIAVSITAVINAAIITQAPSVCVVILGASGLVLVVSPAKTGVWSEGVEVSTPLRTNPIAEVSVSLLPSATATPVVSVVTPCFL